MPLASVDEVVNACPPFVSLDPYDWVVLFPDVGNFCEKVSKLKVSKRRRLPTHQHPPHLAEARPRAARLVRVFAFDVAM